MGQKRGLEGAQAYRENSQKHDFSKSDSEKFLFRKFYVGRGGSKEPPGGIIHFLVPHFPYNMRPYGRAQLTPGICGCNRPVFKKNLFTEPPLDSILPCRRTCVIGL
jgi:hypothetical protein